MMGIQSGESWLKGRGRSLNNLFPTEDELTGCNQPTTSGVGKLADPLMSSSGHYWNFSIFLYSVCVLQQHQ